MKKDTYIVCSDVWYDKIVKKEIDTNNVEYKLIRLREDGDKVGAKMTEDGNGNCRLTYRGYGGKVHILDIPGDAIYDLAFILSTQVFDKDSKWFGQVLMFKNPERIK